MWDVIITIVFGALFCLVLIYFVDGWKDREGDWDE